MVDPGPPVLDLDAAPAHEAAGAPGAPVVPRTPRGSWRRRRAGAGAAVLAVLAAGLLGHHLSSRPDAASSAPGAGAPTDSSGVSARYQRSYERVHVQERTDAALAEFQRCTAAAGAGGDDPLGDRSAATALCRSAYRVTMRTIYADLARAAAQAGQAPPSP